jgi:hypothetical protein
MSNHYPLLEERMSTTHKVLAVLAAAAMITLSSASAAAADSFRCTAGSGCAGRATFTSYGEIFHVYDQLADGHSAVALYWLPDGSGPTMIWNSSGNGSDVTANLELAEGSWITYRVCLGEGGPKTVMLETCGAPITDYA